MDVFGDTVAILNSIVSKSYYGMPREQINCIRIAETVPALLTILRLH